MTVLDFHPPQTNTTFLNDLTSQVGNTPLLPLRRVTAGLNAHVRVYAKAEWFNPGGSIKDRAALNIIRQALASGELRNGRRLLDSTSGNMGISYATFGAALGIPVTLVIPSNASPERLMILRALGVDLHLSDGLEGSDAAIRLAHQIAAAEPEKYWYANQYDNPANWEAHFQSTGPELLVQTRYSLTHFVTGIGTSGTLMGTGRYLHEVTPTVQVIGFEPDDAFHGLEGLKHLPTAIPPGIYDPNVADRMFQVGTEESYAMVRRLAREEGLFVGISSGAAAVAALRIASSLDAGVVATIFPDAGYKYLSDTALWSMK